MIEALVSALFFGMVPVPVPVEPIETRPLEVVQALEVSAPQTNLKLVDTLSASGVIVMDRSSGQVIYEKQARVRRPIASLTKLMTGIVVLESHNLNEIVLLPPDVEEIYGNRAYLPPGHRYTVGDLLSATLISSGNDAAVVLANYSTQTRRDFVTAMNSRARILGLHNTSFANATGIDDPKQFSTPQELAWLFGYSLNQPELKKRLSRKGQRILSSEGQDIMLIHTHQLLHQHSQVLAGKTGTTDEAKECLISLVKSDDREYIVVLLHSAERYEDLLRIINALS